MEPFWNHRGRALTDRKVTNPKGHPTTLQAAHPGNLNGVTHGANSPRFLQPRADEIAAEIMQAPHVVPLDAAGVQQIAAVMARIEALEAAIEKRGVEKAGTMIEQELSSRRLLLRLLEAFGLTPSARAGWAASLGRPTLGEDIARRLRDLEEAVEHDE